jgi:hypothetical protein
MARTADRIRERIGYLLALKREIVFQYWLPAPDTKSASLANIAN